MGLLFGEFFCGLLGEGGELLGEFLGEFVGELVG